MSKKELKIGDRVRVVAKAIGANQAVIGDKGRIVDIRKGKYLLFIVQFDTPRSVYHTCMGQTERKRGYCCFEKMLEKINDETIVIYRNGDTVTAIDKTTKKVGIAKCDPRDTFNFETGAKLALNRLFGKDEPKFLNCKICVTEDTRYGYLTKGKIYEISDGVLIDNKNNKYPELNPLTDLDDLAEYFKSIKDRSGNRSGYFTENGVKYVVVVED